MKASGVSFAPGRAVLAKPKQNTPAVIRVAIVAPSLRILGGQAVQADRLLKAWRGDPNIHAWLVPHNPLPARWLRRALDIKYRTNRPY